MDVGGQIKFKNRRMIIYFLGWFVSWCVLLLMKGKNVDGWDLLIFAPVLSVGSWFTVIYIIYLKVKG